MRLKAIVNGEVYLSGIDEMAIECESITEYKSLFQTLHQMGYLWNDKTSLLEGKFLANKFPIFITIKKYGRITYDYRHWDRSVCCCKYKDLQEDYTSGVDDAFCENKRC